MLLEDGRPAEGWSRNVERARWEVNLVGTTLLGFGAAGNFLT